jgi:hypothetical protein
MSTTALPAITSPSGLAGITVVALLLDLLSLAAVQGVRVDCRDVDRYLQDGAGSLMRDNAGYLMKDSGHDRECRVVLN